MPQTQHIEKHFTAGDTVREVFRACGPSDEAHRALGVSVGLTLVALLVSRRARSAPPAAP